LKRAVFLQQDNRQYSGDVPFDTFRHIPVAQGIDQGVPVVDRNEAGNRLTVFGHHNRMALRLSQCMRWISAEISRGHADRLLPEELLHLWFLIEGLLTGTLCDRQMHLPMNSGTSRPLIYLSDPF
jgi:hypothetical protein